MGSFRFRSPLLTESISLSFPPLTEMFHFSGFRVPYPMYSDKVNQVLPRLGYPIRIPPVLSSLAAPRGFSQLDASFFAFWHLGIHRTPLHTSNFEVLNDIVNFLPFFIGSFRSAFLSLSRLFAVQNSFPRGCQLSLSSDFFHFCFLSFSLLESWWAGQDLNL